MALPANLLVPNSNGGVPIAFDAGSTIVIIGANGSGKTRLGVLMEAALSTQGVEVHRIAAHRSLALNPEIVPPTLDSAMRRLHYGYESGDVNYRHVNRWQSKPETAMLNDFDHLLAALYAENNDVSVAYRQSQIAAPSANPPPKALMDKVREIWKSVLPHRELVVIAGNVKVRTVGENAREYSASDMSDGERVVFYLIAQSLLANSRTVLIFDEPELHINKSILDRLWDEIESSRPDCSFVYITHDVEFASSRRSAAKYVVRAFAKGQTDTWDIESVPESAALPADIIATIVGSRRPILFVEGDGGSLDSALYRRVYSKFTVIPVGSCDHVIHTVSSFSARPELHRIGCAGLVDADGRTDAEAAHLEQMGVYRLPVSEVENLLLLPDVFLALANELKFNRQEAQAKLTELKQIVFTKAAADLDHICLRYTRRRIDAEMKKIGLESADIASLDSEFKAASASVNARSIFDDNKTKVAAAIRNQDFAVVLLYFDNKGLLSEVAKKFSLQQKALEQFIGRVLGSEESSALQAALEACLPAVVSRP